MNNGRESDLRSCEVTYAVTNKAQKKIWGFNGIQTHDLRDTGAMLYRLSYEASLLCSACLANFLVQMFKNSLSKQLDA